MEENKTYGIDTLKVITRNGMTISYVSTDSIEKIVDMYFNGEKYPSGSFIAKVDRVHDAAKDRRIDIRRNVQCWRTLTAY